MMTALFFLLLSVILIYSMLAICFGSREALSSELRNIVEKKKSLRLVVKEVFSGASANILTVLSIGFIVGLGSVIAILFQILSIPDSPILTTILRVGVCGLFFSVGLISVLKREFPGYLHSEGITAVIAGWFFIVVAAIFLLVFLTLSY